MNQQLLDAVEDLRRDGKNSYACIERGPYTLHLDNTGFLFTREIGGVNRYGAANVEEIEVRDLHMANKIEKLGWGAFPDYIRAVMEHE